MSKEIKVSNHMVSKGIVAHHLATKAGSSIDEVKRHRENHMVKVEVFWRESDRQMLRNWG
jgi:hypothetical protein